jgi:hypothetical protein
MDELQSQSGHPIGPLASTLSHIIVYSDCEDTLKPYRATDVKKNLENCNKKTTSFVGARWLANDRSCFIGKLAPDSSSPAKIIAPARTNDVVV